MILIHNEEDMLSILEDPKNVAIYSIVSFEQLNNPDNLTIFARIHVIPRKEVIGVDIKEATERQIRKEMENENLGDVESIYVGYSEDDVLQQAREAGREEAELTTYARDFKKMRDQYLNVQSGERVEIIVSGQDNRK